MLEFVIVVLVFLIAFPLIWCSVCLLLSHVSGWAKLAKHYRTDSSISGVPLRWQSGKVGFVFYKRSLTICVLDDGLRISVFGPFCIGHAPLYIPWSDFRDVKESRFGLFRLLSVSVGDPVITSMMLPEAIKDRFAQLQ